MPERKFVILRIIRKILGPENSILLSEGTVRPIVRGISE